MYKILIVDDEILVADAIYRELTALNPGDMELLRVYSAEEAKEILEQGGIQIVLCDIEMPGASGLELLEWIQVYYPRTEVVMLTCHAEFDYLRQAMRTGCFDYVLKPIDYQELLDVIRKAEQALPAPAALTETEKTESLEVKVKGYIRSHMTEPISVADIADYVGFSPSHLMKLFKLQTGTSILQYMTCERLDAAKELLTGTDLPVSEVGIASGYDNYSYFIKIFKRETGMTPMQWRKTHHKES